MVVQVLSNLLFCTTLFFSLGLDQKRLVQRAVVIEHNAIIYDEPDFDAIQVARMDRHSILAISTRIYRPKNLFGSFYRVFINKPRKIRGYISEIDVIPQYKYTKKGYLLNEEYKKKEDFLKAVKEQSYIRKKKLEALKTEKSREDKSTPTQKQNRISVGGEGGGIEKNRTQEGATKEEGAEEDQVEKDRTGKIQMSQGAIVQKQNITPVENAKNKTKKNDIKEIKTEQSGAKKGNIEKDKVE